MLLEVRIPLRYIASLVAPDALLVVGIASVVEVCVIAAKPWLPDIAPQLPAFLGTAITLLLSFLLGQSYDRWWEARKIWGAIVNDSRTLARQMLTFCPAGEARAEVVCRRQMAWCYSLGQSLRGLDWRTGTADHLSKEDVVSAEKHLNRFAALLLLHGRDVAALAEEGKLSDFRRVTIDQTLTRLTDSMGKAERIKSTVFPRTYRTFIHAFIFLFITLLSLALAKLEGPKQIIVTAVVAIPLLLLEKTARQMQDPFSNGPTDCAVTAIARTIEINSRQMLEDREVPPAQAATDGYFLM